MYITDGTRTVEIIMQTTAKGTSNNSDFSSNFFDLELGRLSLDEDATIRIGEPVYLVGDINYYINRAINFWDGKGEFAELMKADENMSVSVREVHLNSFKQESYLPETGESHT